MLCIFSRVIVEGSSLGPVSSLAMGSRPNLQHYVYISFSEVSLKFNQKRLDYPQIFMP